MALRFFPYAVALLDLGAVAVYVHHRAWREAIIWFCYAVAAAALGGAK